MTPRGSPAWAGIDLVVQKRDAPRRGFPRVGGDRPTLTYPIAAATRVPPRGRG